MISIKLIHICCPCRLFVFALDSRTARAAVTVHTNVVIAFHGDHRRRVV